MRREGFQNVLDDVTRSAVVVGGQHLSVRDIATGAAGDQNFGADLCPGVEQSDTGRKLFGGEMFLSRAAGGDRGHKARRAGPDDGQACFKESQVIGLSAEDRASPDAQCPPKALWSLKART